MMGLFSEIGRAWLTIDSDIYVSSMSLKQSQMLNDFVFFRLVFRFGAMNMDAMSHTTMD